MRKYSAKSEEGLTRKRAPCARMSQVTEDIRIECCVTLFILDRVREITFSNLLYIYVGFGSSSSQQQGISTVAVVGGAKVHEENSNKGYHTRLFGGDMSVDIYYIPPD